jgi:hypothetical protein
VAVGLGISHGFQSSMNLTGLALVVSMGLLIITSLWFFRRKFFEAFYRFHWVFFLLAILFSAIHGSKKKTNVS